MPNFIPQTRPVPHEIEDRIDFVVQWLIDPCDAPITVWLEKFWPAFGELVLEWYAFDLLNMFKAFLKPNLYAIEGRSSRHWGKGEKGKRKGWTNWIRLTVSFDPSEWLGNNVWGAEELRARQIPPLAGYLWIFEGLIERFLWYCMVLDLVTAFAYRWMSAVVETRYCQAADDPVFLGSIASTPLLAIFGMDTLGIWQPDKMRNLSFYNGFGVGGNQGGGTASWSGTVSQPSDAPGVRHLVCRCTVQAGPSAGRFVETSYTFGPGVTQQVGCGMAIQRGDIVIYQYQVDNTLFATGLRAFYQQAFSGVQ